MKSKKELSQMLRYYKQQMRATEIRGGAAEAYKPMIKKLEKQLSKMR